MTWHPAATPRAAQQHGWAIDLLILQCVRGTISLNTGSDGDEGVSSFLKREGLDDPEIHM